MNAGQVGKKPEYLKKPYDNNDYYYDVDDPPDFVIHWNIGIDEP